MSPKTRPTGGNRRAAKPSDDAAADAKAADEVVDEPESGDADSADDTTAEDAAPKVRTVPARKRAARGEASRRASSKSTSSDSEDDADDTAKPKGRTGTRTDRDAKSDKGSKTKEKAETKPAAKSRAGASKPAGKPAKGRKPAGRKPVAPVRVSKSRPWGMIAMFTAVILIFVGIVGYTGYQAWVENMSLPEKARRIDGLVDYRSQDLKWLTRGHKAGPLKYETAPPVGGDHNDAWEDCSGKVYTQQIPNEHAVHSLEHGAVWITYRPDLPATDISTLSKKVQGKDFIMMSPFPNQDKPISLQAWGFQLKVDKASDPRIDQFITTLRMKATVEPGSACSGGVTQTGPTPLDQSQQQQQPGM